MLKFLKEIVNIFHQNFVGEDFVSFLGRVVTVPKEIFRVIQNSKKYVPSMKF